MNKTGKEGGRSERKEKKGRTMRKIKRRMRNKAVGCEDKGTRREEEEGEICGSRS